MRGAKCVIYVVVGEFGKLFRELLIVSFFLRRSEEHTSELQSQSNLVCRLLLEKKKTFHRLGILPRACHRVGRRRPPQRRYILSQPRPRDTRPREPTRHNLTRPPRRTASRLTA